MLIIGIGRWYKWVASKKEKNSMPYPSWMLILCYIFEDIICFNIRLIVEMVLIIMGSLLKIY